MLVGVFFFCRDADDAVYGRDGYDYDGYRLRVEFPRSGRGSRGGFGGIGGAPRGRYGPPSRRSEYRVIVSGKQGNRASGEYQRLSLVLCISYDEHLSPLQCLCI